jgi:redox-sensitive bicupin YhaK (pirin superfamily)
LILSPDGRDESLAVSQDALLWASVLEPGHELEYKLPLGRSAWIQVLRGALEVNGKVLAQGDALAASAVKSLLFKTSLESEFLLFDLKSPSSTD